jgi:hypothetical protein
MAKDSKFKPVISELTWAKIREDREVLGKTFRELEAKYGVSFSFISKRAKAEGWGDGTDFERLIHDRQERKVIGATDLSPKKVAEAIDAEAEKRANVRLRHRKEWEQVAALRQEALEVRKIDLKKAFEKLKLAKITAEMTAIQQHGEIRAYGLEIPVDVKSLSDEQLQAIVDGKMIR